MTTQLAYNFEHTEHFGSLSIADVAAASTSVTDVPLTNVGLSHKENISHHEMNVAQKKKIKEGTPTLITTQETDQSSDNASGSEHGEDEEAGASKKESGTDENSHSDASSDEESSEGEGGDSSDDDDDNGKKDNDDGLSDYERLRMMRIQRNQARLQQLGLLDESNKIPKKNNNNSNRRKSIDGSSNSRQRKPEDLVGLALSRPKRERKSIQQYNIDHLDVRKLRVSRGSKKKKSRCGECEGCTRELDCLTCVFCFERINGRSHPRRCLFKQCRNKYKTQEELAAMNKVKSDADKTLTTVSTAASGEQAKLVESDNNAEVNKETATAIASSTAAGEDAKQEELDSKEEIKSDNRANTSTPKGGGKETEDTHQNFCHVCKDGGDLFLCGKCDLSYHSNCHAPKIKRFPEDDWLCMECRPKKATPGFNVPAVLPDGKEIRIKITEPEANCAVCDKLCPEYAATKEEQSVVCKACDLSFHLNCHDPILDVKPRGRWKCTACKEANKPILEHHQAERAKSAPSKKKTMNLVLYEGEHDDDCYICFNGGELVCCDFCPKVFHCECHIPALPALPTGIWKCCECYASERTRMTRCGECPACLAEDCGKCQFCLDKPKFGGNNTLKKVCVNRECPWMSFAEMVVPGRIPGEIFPAPTSSSKAKAASASNKQTPKPKKRKHDSVSNDVADDKEHKTPKLKKETIVGPEKDAQKVTDVLKKSSETSAPSTAKKRGRPPKAANKDVKDDGPVVAKLKIPKLLDQDSAKVRTIIRTAFRDPHDSKVQDKACENLRKFTTSKANIAKIILAGGVEMIAEAMKNHPDKTIVQAEACATIAGIAWVDPSVATKLSHMGVISLIVSCMDRLQNHAKLQQMGCGAFRALSYLDTNVGLIINAGGLSAVLDSMNRNPRKLLVQREGCCKF